VPFPTHPFLIIPSWFSASSYQYSTFRLSCLDWLISLNITLPSSIHFAICDKTSLTLFHR
jgi:hypothetical protein